VGVAIPDPAWTDAPPTTNPHLPYPRRSTLVTNRNRLGGVPPSGWTVPPTWGPPLHDPLPLHAAGLTGRWLYPTVAAGSFLLVAGFMVAHDDPTPGLSARGLLTIVLAAAVVILLSLRRSAGAGPLARTLGEYTVVFLLAVLLATTGISPTGQAPRVGRQASAIDQRPALVKTIDHSWDRLTGAWDWLTELWRRADPKTAPRPKSAESASSPGPQPSTWRPL
jgi:hypothetical protein